MVDDVEDSDEDDEVETGRFSVNSLNSERARSMAAIEEEEDEDTDEISSVMLGKEAERILENAKKRLTVRCSLSWQLIISRHSILADNSFFFSSIWKGISLELVLPFEYHHPLRHLLWTAYSRLVPLSLSVASTVQSLNRIDGCRLARLDRS
jgi:hypothetical protein